MERPGGIGRVVTIGAALLFVLCGAAGVQGPRVEARECFREGRMVLTVQAAGGRTPWTGGELGIPRDELGGAERDQWFDPARELCAAWIDAPSRPQLDLTIQARGSDRRVDLPDVLPEARTTGSARILGMEERRVLCDDRSSLRSRSSTA